MTASIPSVFSGEVLHAVTIGWPDQVASEASLANLGLTVGGIGITAGLVMARATASLGGTGSGASLVDNLSINGVPVAVTGEPNQTVSIPGGRVVVNEQTASPAGTTVNALHATVFGVTDVVIASATAAIAHFVPTPCDFVTSGGFVFKDNGERANFGAHGGCKENGPDAPFWGHVNYVDHDPVPHMGTKSPTT